MLFLASNHLGVDVGAQLKPMQHNWRYLGEGGPSQSVLSNKREEHGEKAFLPATSPGSCLGHCHETFAMLTSHFVTTWADISGIKRLTF